MKALVALVLVPLAASAAAAAAQEPPDPLALEYRGVPRRVAERIVAVFEDPATTRWEGGRRLEAGEVVKGNVAASGGLVVVAGRIEGELVVLDGDVEFLPGGAVAGDVTVVRGEVRGVGEGSIGGTLLVYGRVEREAQPSWERERERRRYGAYWYGPPLVPGSARLVVDLRPNYNRVEGLPIAVGPRITTSGRNPLRVEALGILRSEGDRPLDGDQVGYAVRAEQFLGGSRELRVGLAARSVISPIETWQVSDLEASLATFLLHSDQRDYFEREGWSAYARYTPRRLPLDVTVEYRDEEHGIAAVADPWTLFGNDPWRPQPLVAEGRLRSLVGEATLDLRSERNRLIDDGWYLSARLHRGLSGDLSIPALFLPTVEGDASMPGARVRGAFTAGFLDVRRYNRVGAAGSLDLRAVLGGSLTETALPPQFQHALGGAGSLPGYRLMGVDCGARDVRGTLDADAATPTFFPRYGCDRIALLQAEYRGGLVFDVSWADDDDADGWEWGFDWDGDVTWALFFDAARGWAFDGASPAARRDTGTLYDVGAGIVFDDNVGIYAAVPLNGDERNVRVFVRLGLRF
mgnify:CR=1 FL=1